jgi:hypothetical protein
MHKFIFALAIVASMTASLNAAAQSQSTELPDPLEMAAKMADQLEKDLELDPGQVFKIDTLFQHVYTDYYAELEKLAKSGVSASSSQYLRVSDRWGAYIDDAIAKIVDEEQWAKYLKTDAGRAKKKRDKRMAEDKY